ncbi:MAG: phosphoribosylamine--glycine ligase [Flavobacteriia bacterium]|nr:MAG: phosphoribosylamine--glycine ligase [Flavobacteriia bacterium]
MKIAIIGSGGREHALAWAFAKTEGWENVFTLPGNGGIPNAHAVDTSDFKAVESFCHSNGIDFIFVGPEQPLAEGIVDYFRATTIKILGPDKVTAQLEASKIFAKQFMQKHGVSTAKYEKFASVDKALAYGLELKGNCVIKYDGLAAGKGVFVCDSEAVFKDAMKEVAQTYGQQAPLIIEQRLVGDEVSVIGFTDGKSMKLFQPSQDHKQLLEGDQGPNTGGMGAYTPVEGVSEHLLQKVDDMIVQPTLKGIRAEGMDYRGVIYFGIMVEAGVPYLLEYNVRFGDPETEVLLPSLKTPLKDVALACVEKRLSEVDMVFHKGYFADVVLVSGGYPKQYDKGYEITGLNQLPDDITVFHAGTALANDKIVTNGGRVLNVVARGETLQKALDKVYHNIQLINFDKQFYRKDIGQRENKNLR